MCIRDRICTIQKYKCIKCGKVFYTDLLSLVYSNSNITLPVIECIETLYQIYGSGLHKIRFYLKQQHNIEISHQSIENILLNSNYQLDVYKRQVLSQLIVIEAFNIISIYNNFTTGDSV